jgi:hypothetical protein
MTHSNLSKIKNKNSFDFVIGKIKGLLTFGLMPRYGNIKHIVKTTHEEKSVISLIISVQ